MWKREADKGLDEGRKDRPVVVVLARRKFGDAWQLFVAPITHSEPGDGRGIAIPPRVKAHLGLDDERSWIVTDEVNIFIWPGPDVRLVEGADDPYYGTIPAALLAEVQRQIGENIDAHRIVPRAQ